MKITEIRIKNYLQFKDFHLNLTYPDTGQPLEKICFIGSNGTGKTTLLNIISNVVNNIGTMISQKNNNFSLALDNNRSFLTKAISPFFSNFNNDSLIYIKIKEKIKSIQLLITAKCNYCFDNKNILNDTIWNKLLNSNLGIQVLSTKEWKDLEKKNNYQLINKIQFKNDLQDILCYAKSDITKIENKFLPESNVNQALKFFENFPLFHDVSFYNVNEFWKVLIYRIKKRENEYLEFMNNPNIENLSVKEAKARFDQEYPEILQKLAEQWNLILEKPGLEFDVENAKIPVQLNDNLEAYIKLRNTNKVIPYNKLSTGIRNFIFQLGYIYTLYFNRDIQRGFLLIDEPEASLFPDLLYDIIDRYLSIIQNTQFFVATHSPIIAGQFDPAERFILEFDDDGYVTARSGVSPEGDDPNDLLVNDFVVRSLYGKKGVEKWQRYLELQRLIPETKDKEHKKELLKEYSSIGNAYNFLPHEISE